MSVIVQRRSSRRLQARLAAGLLLLFIESGAVQAQTVRVKLVDGRDGHAVTGTCVNLWVGEAQKWAISLPTDSFGVASIRLVAGGTESPRRSRAAGCGGLGALHPVVRYAPDLRINVGFVLCQARRSDHSWLATQEFSTDKVLRSGIVTANFCGAARAAPMPGEIIIFVRPLHWWEKLRE